MTTTATPDTWGALRARLDGVKKPVKTLRLCEDPEIRDTYRAANAEAAEAEQHLAQAKTDGWDADHRAPLEAHAKRARTALTAAKKAYDAATITLRFRALEQQELEALQTAHRPTEQDEAEGAEFAYDTFAPALIAAASLDGMPADYAAQCLKTWAPADARDLWQAAWTIQHTRRTDLGKD